MIKSLFSENKLQYGNRILWDPIGLWVSTLALKKSGSNGELWPEDFEWGSSGFYFRPTKLKWDTVKALSWIIVEVVKSSVCWFVCLALLQSLFQFTWNLFRVAKLATPKTVWNFWGWILEHGPLRRSQSPHGIRKLQEITHPNIHPRYESWGLERLTTHNLASEVR